MTDHQEEMLALHALRTLTPEEVRLLESESKYDARMRDTLQEFEETAGEIGCLLPTEAPPPEVRAELLARLKTHVRGNVTPFATTRRILGSPLVAWATAAVIAVAAVSQWNRGRQLDQKVAALAQDGTASQEATARVRADMLDLQKRLADADTKIAALSAELDSAKKNFVVANMEVSRLRSLTGVKRYDDATSLVVWDQKKQEGVLKLEDMPAVPPNKDYQLWVICKRCRHPVSAGIVKVGADGTTTITFRPAHHIDEPQKFAISVEVQGGVTEKPEGQLIFATR